MIGNLSSSMDAIEREAAFRAVRSERDRAKRDALRAIARDIPDPAEYARQCPLWIAEALVAARYVPQANEFRVSLDTAVKLKPYGLVDAGTGITALTAFAIAVRRALQAQDA